MIIKEKSWQQNITANISGVCGVCCILHSRELKENKTLSVLDRQCKISFLIVNLHIQEAVIHFKGVNAVIRVNSAGMLFLEMPLRQNLVKHSRSDCSQHVINQTTLLPQFIQIWDNIFFQASVKEHTQCFLSSVSTFTGWTIDYWNGVAFLEFFLRIQVKKQECTVSALLLLQEIIS